MSVNNSNGDEKEKNLFSHYSPVAFKYFKRDKIPRKWCLQIITSPWFERMSIFIIIVNCITLGMYKPCEDQIKCISTRCFILKYMDHIIFTFFTADMLIKIFAMGLYGKNTYLAESWNRLDFIIVLAE